MFFRHPIATAALILGAVLMLCGFLVGALVPHSADDPDSPRTVEFRKAKPDGSPVDRPYLPEETP